jgi:hypothetical protein
MEEEEIPASSAAFGLFFICNSRGFFWELFRFVS